MHYGEFLRNLRGATNYRGYRRGKRPSRTLGKTGPAPGPTIRAGWRRKRNRVGANDLLVLAWPGAAVLGLGLMVQAWDPMRTSTKVPVELFPIVAMVVCVVSVVCAWTSAAHPAVRRVAIVVNPAYFAWLVISGLL